MVETNRSGPDPGGWRYLINQDKSPSPQLEQLCLGLAKIICNLESGPSDRLTPQRLAAFYKSVGGSLDDMFLRTSQSGLSFLYRTIGCYHSLEPSTNPFETPSLPCLTPEGFVKWQTVQLLLCPAEHVGYLQEAVRKYDVPRSNGGTFPKTIPQEVFPDKPDAEMEAWHKQVTSQLNQENYMRRIKNSPYHSPYPSERTDGYFSQQPVPRIRRPSRPARQGSKEAEMRSPDSRRCSEGDFKSPLNPVDHARNPYAYSREERSTSGTRPNVGPRQRSATTGHPIKTRQSNSASHHPNDRPPSSYMRGQYPDRPIRNANARSLSSSSVCESSGDDASSEDSRGQRRSRRSKATSTLLSVLPFTTPWTRRSRSHDASSYRKDKPASKKSDRDTPPPMRASTETFQRPQPSVRFRQDIFDKAANSAPESPAFNKRPHSAPRPDPRYTRNPGLTDPVSSAGYNMNRDTSSGSGSDKRATYEIPLRQQWGAGAPQRSGAYTGVQGRKYASVEQVRDGPFPPGIPPGAAQQDPRTRYSLAV